MTGRQTFFMVFLLLAAMLLMSSLYTVREGQAALVMRLGKIVTDGEGKPLVKNPGLHFKVPLINQVRYFDVRLQTQDIKESLVVTKNKKDVLVDYYLKWRIANLPRYFTRTGGEAHQAEQVLQRKLDASLRDQFGKRTISEVVADDRTDIMAMLRRDADDNAENMGIDVIDVRIKRIDLPVTVSNSVYDRMRAEREQVAKKHRAEGQAIGNSIRAEADREVIEITAEADRDAKRIRGEGDAKATEIYASAYSKDTQFYAFLRSLEAYQASFRGNKDFIILKPDGEFFKYFQKSGTS